MWSATRFCAFSARFSACLISAGFTGGGSRLGTKKGPIR